jgi:hypothetical protein
MNGNHWSNYLFSKIEVKDIRDALPELVMSLMIPYPHHFFDLHGKKVKESQFNRHPFFFPLNFYS